MIRYIFIALSLFGALYALKPQSTQESSATNELTTDIAKLKLELGSDYKPSLPHEVYIDPKDNDFATRNALQKIYDDADAKSGFFVGANIGFVNLYTQDSKKLAIASPFLFGMKAGYLGFVNQYFGARLTGFMSASLPLSGVSLYNVGSGDKTPALSDAQLESFYALAGLSADVLFEFPLNYNYKHYLGGFAGINIGTMYYRTYVNYKARPFIWDYNFQVDYSFNLGISLTLFNKNRIEFYYNIPFAFLELPGFAKADSASEGSTFYRSPVLFISYSYVF
ncbi:outer membrane beta-barrel protein [Helicobacter sp. 11S02629-2]|uniref:outer membrane beta-barrel protein n=1 Tax=Helicobacter sp. 11S02629-2 TaxID=1476195 RepID=UPI000BA727EB|nr:outer membrane beta-barrel protein [Helicobacter sp. 11S02629-2]PAF45437.1 hypothetical protein BKH40_02930 [Helicobacter sp. 11S02629-2]